MTEFLVFRLYGPMASWGEIAVGEIRGSATHPTKSAVLGLVAAALRMDRDDEEGHGVLAHSLGFGVRVDAMGTPLVDYHTAQVPASGSGRNPRKFATRREELTAVPRQELRTVLSRRDYRLDALSIVAVWTRVPEPRWPLPVIREALERPGYLLYLGRRSCPLALPLEPQILTTATLREAFREARFAPVPGLEEMVHSSPEALFWDEGVEAGAEPSQMFFRRDVPTSRRRWQFEVRKELSGSPSKET